MTEWQPSAWPITLAKECDDAKQRLTRLTTFIGSPAFESLSWRQRSLMLRQIVIMGEYIQVLEERLQEITQS